MIDRERYFNRIGYRGGVDPSAATLRALHLSHATHIPFENLDVLAGRPIRLDLESLQEKLVVRDRGGYCFEQNLLFAAVLEQLGFVVRRMAARVRYRTTSTLPRTHMLLLVEADGRTWLADVGFGGEGLLSPVLLENDAPAAQFAWTYRVVAADGQWTLQSLRAQSWTDLYSFTEEPQHLADFEMYNYYVSTHPSSRFVHSLTAQLPTPQARFILRNREMTIDRGVEVETRLLESDAEVTDALREVFRLRIEPDMPMVYGDATAR